MTPCPWGTRRQPAGPAAESSAHRAAIGPGDQRLPGPMGHHRYSAGTDGTGKQCSMTTKRHKRQRLSARRACRPCDPETLKQPAAARAVCACSALAVPGEGRRLVRHCASLMVLTRAVIVMPPLQPPGPRKSRRLLSAQSDRTETPDTVRLLDYAEPLPPAQLFLDIKFGGSHQWRIQDILK